MTINSSLKSMGYRRMPHENKVIWGKPVGNSLFTIEFSGETAHYTCWFKGASGKILVWSHEEKTLDQNPGKQLLDWIKYVETWCSRVSNAPVTAEFQFLTIEEQMYDML